MIGIFTLTSGKFNKQIVSVSNSCMYAWGYSLEKANLMLNLQPGDKCSVKYSISYPIKAAPYPVVKTLWFGSQKSSPTEPTDPGLLNWLTSKGITIKDFTNWIDNQIQPKPYFPFSTNIYGCKVIGFLREENSFSAQGVYLEFFRTTATSDSAKAIGLLMREDFYLCGVAAFDLDLRFLLRHGDRINCQLMPVTNTDKIRLQKELALPESVDVTYIANLGYLGADRPQEANQSPLDSNPALEKWLASRGHTVEEFKSMRNPANLAQGGTNDHKDSDISIATDIATRSLSLANSDVKTFLQNERQVEIACQIVQVLSRAISSIGQDKELASSDTILESKLKCLKGFNLNSNEDPRTSEEGRKTLKAAPGLSQLPEPTRTEKSPKTGLSLLQDSYDFKDLSLAEKMKQVQNSLAKEAVAAQELAAKAAKTKSIMVDGKRRLASYKASLLPKQPTALETAAKKEISPLEYLRDYIANNKKIYIDRKTIWFDDVGFPKCCKTNLKNSVGIGTAYYTLETLYHFMTIYPTNRAYGDYLYLIKKVQKPEVPPVHKNDAEAIFVYLQSANGQKPPNLVDISHNELNPGMISEQASTENDSSKNPKRFKRSGSPRKSRFSRRSSSPESPKNSRSAHSSSPVKSSFPTPVSSTQRCYDPSNPTESSSPPQATRKQAPQPWGAKQQHLDESDAKWEQYRIDRERQQQKQLQDQEQRRQTVLKAKEEAERLKREKEEEHEKKLRLAQEEAQKHLQFEQLEAEIKRLGGGNEEQERSLRLWSAQETVRARQLVFNQEVEDKRRIEEHERVRRQWEEQERLLRLKQQEEERARLEQKPIRLALEAEKERLMFENQERLRIENQRLEKGRSIENELGRAQWRGGQEQPQMYQRQISEKVTILKEIEATKSFNKIRKKYSDNASTGRTNTRIL